MVKAIAFCAFHLFSSTASFLSCWADNLKTGPMANGLKKKAIRVPFLHSANLSVGTVFPYSDRWCWLFCDVHNRAGIPLVNIGKSSDPGGSALSRTKIDWTTSFNTGSILLYQGRIFKYFNQGEIATSRYKTSKKYNPTYPHSSPPRQYPPENASSS